LEEAVKVVVAMSGGVDSSVTAGLLVEQGHEVIGVHMKLHDATGGGPGRCCGYDDALDARAVADTLGIPFYVFNLRDAFRKAVVDDFVGNYLAGSTPNPCIQCNGVLKFRVLLARARALGASHLATGHYARIVNGPDGQRALAMAADPDKDQSYFLFPMTQAALDRTLFPLGGLTKPEVRALGERQGLVTASKPESQEICFIPDDDHGRFVAETSEADGAGPILDEEGREVGRHDGYFRYTVGQRRGLGVALGAPAYVTKVDPARKAVHVTTRPRQLLHGGLTAQRANWFHRPSPDEVVHVRIRHRGGLVPCRVDGPVDQPQVRFLEPARAVAPGQAAVFYAGERVLGGAWITAAFPWTEAA
jgi:tRNA-specific 2-thiouridylase